MRFLNFILSHSIFISLCAAALCIQTCILLNVPLNIPAIAFVSFSTLCSYNFYWLLSKFYFTPRPVTRKFISRHFSFILLFIISATACAFFLLKLQHIASYIFIALILTLLYSLPLWPFKFTSHLQKAGIFKTTLLAFTWAYVTTILPAADLIATQSKAVILLLTARFFFMLLLCIIFDMRDIAIDKIHGLHSLATDISPRRLSVIIFFVFLCYIAAGFMLRLHFHDFRQEMAFAVTGIIVWIVYLFSRRKRSYLFYYFLTDGLMFISALLTYLAAMV